MIRACVGKDITTTEMKRDLKLTLDSSVSLNLYTTFITIHCSFFLGGRTLQRIGDNGDNERSEWTRASCFYSLSEGPPLLVHLPL